MDTSRKKFVSSVLTKTDPQTQLLALIKKLDITYSHKSRSKYIKEYCDFIKCFAIDEHRQLRNCWNTVRNMLLNKENPELQKAGFDIMCTIVQAHHERLGSLQYDCFYCICQLPQGSAYGPILLTHLTKGGLDILFKDEVTELLLSWIKYARQSMGGVLSREHCAKGSPLNDYTDTCKNYKAYFLALSTISDNIIAYHFPSMNEAHRTEIILGCCHLLTDLTSREEYAIRIIHVLRTISTHCFYIPSDCFTLILSTLAKIAEFQELFEESKPILQKFQGLYHVHMIKILVSILEQSSPHRIDVCLIRGAVFLISYILWNVGSTEIVPSYFFNTILTTIESVLYCVDLHLAHKVLSSIQKLVKSYGRELKLEWETICNILSKLHEITTQKNSVDLFAPILQDLFLVMNENRHDNIFLANEKFFWDVIEEYSSFVPEAVLVQALEYRSREIHPLNSCWIDALEHMVKTYIVDVPRKDSPIQNYPFSIKLNVLKFLKGTFDSYSYFYGDLIVQKTLVSLKRAYPCDNAALNKTCIELIVHFANGVYTESIFFKVVDYLIRFIQKDCNTGCNYFATQKLLDLFYNKFSTKFTNHVLYLYDLLISLLPHDDVKIRSDVQALFSSLRATPDGSFSLDGTSSPYLKVLPRSNQLCPSLQRRETTDFSASNVNSAVSYLNVSVLFDALQNRLCKEPCPELFESICKTLMNFLQNYWMMAAIPVTPLVSLLLKILRNQLFGVVPQSLLYPEGVIGHLKTGYELLLSTIPYIFYEKHSDESILSLRKSVIETFVFAISNQHLLPPGSIDHTLLQVCFSALIQCNHIAPALITDYIPSITKIVCSLSSVKQPVPFVNCPDFKNSAPLVPLSLDTHFYILEYLHAIIREPALIDISIKNSKLIWLTLLNFTHPDRVSPPLAVLAFQILANWFIHIDISNRSSVFDLILHSVKRNFTHQRSYIAEAYIDLFSRLIFTNFEPIDAMNYLHKNIYNMSMLFNEKLNSATQSWYRKNVIFTIKTNSIGWAHVVVRRASGTASWLMHFQKKLRNVQNITKGDAGICDSSKSDIMPDIIGPQYLALSDSIDYLKKLVEQSQKTFESEPIQNPHFPACNCHLSKFSSKSNPSSRNSKKSRLSSKQKLKKAPSKNLLKHKSIHRKASTLISANTLDTCDVNLESAPSVQGQSPSKLTTDALTKNFQTKKFRQKDCVGDNDAQKQDINFEISNLRTIGNKSSIEAPSSFSKQVDYENVPARDIQGSSHQRVNRPVAGIFGFLSRKSKSLSFSVYDNSCKNTQTELRDTLPLVSKQNGGLSRRYIPLSYIIEFPVTGSLFTFVNINAKFERMACLTPELGHLHQINSFSHLAPFNEDVSARQLDLSGDMHSRRQKSNHKAERADKAAEISKTLDFMHNKVRKDNISITKANDIQDLNIGARVQVSCTDEVCIDQSEHPVQNYRYKKPSTTTNKNSNSPNNSVKKNYKLDSRLNTEKVYPAICPSFVFSQFQPFICEDDSGAKALEQSGALDRALAVLDLTIACETYKAGLMYVAPGQVHLEDILGNTHGSSFYNNFIRFLGDIVLLKDSCFFTGGLDKTRNLDGAYSLLWRDNVSQIMFHVTTLMPNLPSDPTFVNKTRHIGNDYIIIIWHDRDDAKCSNDTLAGHFNLITIAIHSLNNGWYRISVQSKNQMCQPAPFLSPQLVHGEDQLAHFVRILVINAHYLCQWSMMNQKKIDVVSHYEERLRQINQIGQRLIVKNVDDLDQLFVH